jgi:3-phenylpropionate/cinnamic acid dioxygenase small subunit
LIDCPPSARTSPWSRVRGGAHLAVVTSKGREIPIVNERGGGTAYEMRELQIDHFFPIVRIREVASDAEVLVACNFIAYRTRLATDEDLWIGEREDRLRRVDGQWKIAGRKIFLDQTVLKSKNLSSFL